MDDLFEVIPKDFWFERMQQKKKQKLDIGPYKLANKYIYLTLRENRGYFRCDSNSFRVLDVPSLN